MRQAGSRNRARDGDADGGTGGGRGAAGGSRRHVGDGRRTAGTVRGGGDADGGTGGRHGRRHGNRRCVGDGRQTAGTVRGTSPAPARPAFGARRRAAAEGMWEAAGGQPEPCAGRRCGRRHGRRTWSGGRIEWRG